MGDFNMRELLERAWESTRKNREHAVDIIDDLNERRIPRRTLIVGLFGAAMGSTLLKETTEEPRNSEVFFNEIIDNFYADLQELNFSEFLQEIENKSIAELHVTDNEAIITRHNGSFAKTKIDSPVTILDLMKDKTIDPETIDIHFKNHPINGLNITKGVKDTILENWEISASVLGAWPAYKEAVEFANKYINKGNKSPPEELKNTAYHEAAHATAAILRQGTAKCISLSIEPKNGILGRMGYTPILKGAVSKQEYENNILGLLAGRAAEEKLDGIKNYTDGANGDMEKCYIIATDMVTKFGMSDDIGPVVKPDSPKTSLLGRIFRRDTEPQDSEVMKVRIENAREKILRKGLDDARTFVVENWDAIDRVAEALLIHKTLSAEEIEKLVYQDQPKPDVTLG